MTDAEKVKYLCHYRYIDALISTRSREVAKFKRWADHDVSQRVTDKCLSIVAQIQNEIYQLEQDRVKIEAVVDAVQDERCLELLRHRYLEQMTWEQVAALMCYSVRNCHRLHSQALEMVVIL